MRFDWIFAGAVALASLATGAYALVPEDSDAVPAAVALAVSTTPLPLDADTPQRDRVGALRFLGAVQIRSSNPQFGGLSGLRTGLGTRMLALSDTGNWFAFDTVETGERLTGIANGLLAPVRHPDGGIARSKAEGDSEALDWDPGTGEATIVYEQAHRLEHFHGLAATPAGLAAVPWRSERLTAMTGWPSNGGGEAMAVLPGGARVVISEVARRPDGSAPLLLTRGDATVEHGVAVVPGHSPTDAIALDATHILVLNRQFSALKGPGVALGIVDLAPALAGGSAVLPQRLLAQWGPPLTLDNMEGLALRRRGGRVFVYIVSDDNLSSLQRTILMKFELLDAPAG